MLQENMSLESLVITSHCQIKVEDYLVLVTALQHNETLKTLSLYRSDNHFVPPPPLTVRLTDDEDKRMATFLKKNYAIERIPEIDTEDVAAILRLNDAGRRYLTQNGSSISKGVVVLGRVNNDINCAFLHLLENPRLCDRRAEKMVAAGKSNGRSKNTNASNGGGKRKGGSAQKRMQVMVEENRREPAHTKSTSPAGDWCSFGILARNEMGQVLCLVLFV
jgi:hypothetical protein